MKFFRVGGFLTRNLDEIYFNLSASILNKAISVDNENKSIFLEEAETLAEEGLDIDPKHSDLKNILLKIESRLLDILSYRCGEGKIRLNIELCSLVPETF
jgi:hypothetical protein